MRYIKKADFIFAILLVVVMASAASALAASVDYYLKIDGIEGEAEESRQTGTTRIQQEEGVANTGIEPDEIDYDGSQETSFGVLLDSGISSDASDEAEESRQTGTTRIQQEEGVANTGIEPDEIDVAVDNETTAAVDVFIKIPPIDGEANERIVGLNGLYIDYFDDDSDADGLRADHEAEITLKGQAGSRTSVQYPYRAGTRIRVEAQTVRGWDQETKEAVRARLVGNDAKNDVANLGLFIALQALDNEAITNINVEDKATIVMYRTKLAVFGFIPVEINAEARVDQDGEVKVKYPWWHFLARKSSDDTVYRNIAAQVSARIAIE